MFLDFNLILIWKKSILAWLRLSVTFLATPAPTAELAHHSLDKVDSENGEVERANCNCTNRENKEQLSQKPNDSKGLKCFHFCNKLFSVLNFVRFSLQGLLSLFLALIDIVKNFRNFFLII
jgi:hypothetical protein